MSTAPFRRNRVLLVDDEPKLLAGLRRALHKEPFEVLTAESGAEALAILQRTPVDAVVSDQDMPSMSGVELFAVVSKQYPDTVRIMLTGKATLDLAIEAINFGSIQRFFTKPMNPEVLAAQLGKALAQKMLQEETWRLVLHAREQEALLERLEREQPEVLQWRAALREPLVLEEPPETLEELLLEIERTLGTSTPSPRQDAL